MTSLPEPTAAKTVLICEDDSNLRTLVRLALGDGYRFFEAPDGPTGLALAHRTHPDLIVLDLMLPGQGGLDVLAELRRADDLAETPVIVISAWSHSDVNAIEVHGSHVGLALNPEVYRILAHLLPAPWRQS